MFGRVIRAGAAATAAGAAAWTVHQHLHQRQISVFDTARRGQSLLSARNRGSAAADSGVLSELRRVRETIVGAGAAALSRLAGSLAYSNAWLLAADGHASAAPNSRLNAWSQIAHMRGGSVDDAIADAVNKALGGSSADAMSDVAPARVVRRTGPRPTPGSRLVGQLIFANILVYIGWKLPVPAVQHFMMRWFTTSALSLGQGARGFLTNFTANYSHSGIVHLGVNMLALNSFGRHCMDGTSTQTHPKLSLGEFLSMYTAAGFIGSLSSNLFAATALNGMIVPSLGASGAIFGVATYFMMMHPTSQVQLLFVFNMSSSSALGVLTGVNVGLCAWQVIAARAGRPGPLVDGMAHLGGTVVGWLAFQLAKMREAGRAASAPRVGRPELESGTDTHHLEEWLDTDGLSAEERAENERWRAKRGGVSV